MSCSSRTLCSCLCSEEQRGCNTHASLSWAPWTTVEPFCQHLHWSLCWSWLSTGSSLPFFGQSASGSLSTLSEEKLGLSSEPQAWGKMSFADALGLAALGPAHGDFGNSTWEPLCVSVGSRGQSQGMPEQVAEVPLDEMSNPVPGSPPCKRAVVVLTAAALRSAPCCCAHSCSAPESLIAEGGGGE